MTETRVKLRPFFAGDTAPLIDLMNTGIGALVGEPGFISVDDFSKIRTSFAAEQVITAERQLKTYVIGYCGIRNYNIAARRAELWSFCISPSRDKSIPDKKTISVILDWVFGSLGLNKITTDVLELNQIMSTLEENGFVSEGVRRGQYRIGSKYFDATVMGCLAGGRTK
jgi:RimJ/RimL family protein N-acetyltransferase